MTAHPGSIAPPEPASVAATESWRDRVRRNRVEHTEPRSGLAVPILMYHQVMRDPPAAFRKYAVTPATFAAQMRWLTLAGYTSISLDQLLAHRSAGTPLPRRPVVITFDDGYQAAVDHAVPILRAHGFTATFYLVAGLIGKSSRWLAHERGIDLPLVDWSTARDLCAAGFSCGAHTMTHPRLAELGERERHVELQRSKAILEENLGCDVGHMTYPFGSYDEGVCEAAASLGYRSACSVRIGPSPPSDDPYALHRVPVTGYDSLADFPCRLLTGFTVRESIRLIVPRAIRPAAGGRR